MRFGGDLGPRYVLANIPAARIEAIENGVAVSRHTAVVGKPDRPSPEINSKIVQINFNPYWTVPPSIVQKDLIPKMQDQPDYLTKNHIRIFDSQQKELQPSQINWYSEDATHYSFKQDPGSTNSLGSIRINFPSAFGVYMHDTPLKNLFGEDFRFHSSGCMRVQNVRQLVGVAARRDERLVAGRDRSRHQIRRPQGRAADQAGAAALGVCDRLVGRRRRGAIPRGYLRQGRPRRDPSRDIEFVATL